MKKEILERIIAERKRRREAEENKAAERKAAMFSVSEISDAHAEYTNLVFENIKKPLSDPSRIKKTYDKYLAAMKKYGYSLKDFEYRPVCKICSDAGVKDGKICKCVRDEYISELKRECEIDLRAPFSFTDCNTEKIKDEKQKTALDSLYRLMKAYVRVFPEIRYPLLVFTGGTGTGKSCLASAMARGFVERGKSALIFSAYEFNAKMLECHTSPISERSARMNEVIKCDALIIDDLGTEPMLKNVTLEYLQLVLDERVRNKKCTVITTNLDMNGLLRRYGERIFSRLSDKAHSLMRNIPGDDLRLK